MFFTAEHNLLYPAMGVRNGPISCYDQLMWHGRHLQMGDYYTKWIWTALFPWLVPSTLDNSNTYSNDNNDSFFLFMHLSTETPTPGRRGAYMGISKCLDDLPAPKGWGNSSLSTIYIVDGDWTLVRSTWSIVQNGGFWRWVKLFSLPF